MTTRDRLAAAAAVAVLLTASGLHRIYEDLGWLVPVAGAVLAVALAGAALRRARVPALLQPLGTVAALAAYTVLITARDTLDYAVLPTAETLRRVLDVVGQALLDVEELAAPVPTEQGLVLLAVLGVGAVAVVVDLLAVALQRPAVAGLALLTAFTIPSATLPGGVGAVAFLLAAAGWLALLLVEGTDRARRWGSPSAKGYEDPGIGRVGRRIGAAALGVAVVVPLLVPGLDGRLFGEGTGDGFGGGSRTTTTYNPITQLGGQLRLPTPQPLLSYRTDDPEPDYVRLTTLDRFEGDGWASSELQGNVDDDLVSEGIPSPVGVDGTSTVDVTTTVRLRSLDGPWLPVPFTPSDVQVDGPWLWDREAETVFSTRRSAADVEEPYTVRSARVVPDAALLRREQSLPPEIAPYAEVPPVTPFVAELTQEVTQEATSDYDRVAALQAFFRDRGNGFRYSEDASVPGVDSPDLLERFLRGRRGFCEQYASAMAAMVRVLGIPARVGVGFTPGDPQPDGTRLVTTSDAHAWPEVWFAGAGWVRFEPTPRGEQVTTPEYTQAPVEVPTAPVPVPSASAAPQAPVDGSDPGARSAREREDVVGGTTGSGAGDGGVPTAVPVLLAVLGVALLPFLLSALRRRARWSSPTPEAAWAQVRDDAVDVGHRWRPSESPRAAAVSLVAARRLTGEPAEALHRLAAAAASARYARPGSVEGPGERRLRADADRVRAGLLAGLSGRRRLVVRLLQPASLRWASSTLGSRAADLLDGVDEVFAAGGRLLRRRPARTGSA